MHLSRPVARRWHLLAVSTALLLGGCLGSTESTAPKLTGPRLDVTLQPTVLQASAGALAEPLQLPPPVTNPNWGQSGSNAAHQPGHLSLPAKVVRAWSSRVGGGSGRGAALLSPPVVHSGRVFVVNTKGEITALNAVNGKELWQVTLPFAKSNESRLTGGIAVLGNLLIATMGDGQVIALTASSGKQVWLTNLGVPLRAAPSVEGERVIVVSHDNRTFALNALNGAMVWTHSGMEGGLILLQAASPAIANGMVAVPYSSGEVYVLRASDGRYIWHDTLSSPFTGQDPASTVSSIAAPPVLADGLLYVVGLNGGLTAYGATNGQRFWRADILTSQLPIVVGFHIFALTEKGELAALNRRDGAIRWVTDLNSGLPEADGKRLWSGPVFAGGRLIANSSDGYAVSVHPRTGKRIAATQLDDETSLPGVVANNQLFFLTDSARVIAFSGAPGSANSMVPLNDEAPAAAPLSPTAMPSVSSTPAEQVSPTQP